MIQLCLWQEHIGGKSEVWTVDDSVMFLTDWSSDVPDRLIQWCYWQADPGMFLTDWSSNVTDMLIQ